MRPKLLLQYPAEIVATANYAAQALGLVRWWNQFVNRYHTP
jgi:hypothetical protein